MFGLGDASAIVGGIESPSFKCILDPGGVIGSSGRSSRKRDFVRFGTPELTRRGVKLDGGVGTCSCGVCIESRDVLENEDGPPELRLFLFPHLKMDAHEIGPLEPLVSDPLCICSE